MAEQIKVYNTDPKLDSNGTKIPVSIVDVNDVNKNFEIAMVGEGVEDYILEINNNFVKLLENFAGSVTPPKASTTDGKVEGQIWFDNTNNKVNFKTATEWTSNATELSGKRLDAVREYILAGLDTTGKLSKTGGTVTGKININGAVSVAASIIPSSSETASLGGPNNRFRNIYLKENGIVLGDESAGLRFKPENYVYVVTGDDSKVDTFPTGAIILHQETGEAIIKKSTGTFNASNSTFRKLSDDKQNSAKIGGNRFLFMGPTGLVAGGWGNGNWTSNIEKVTLTSPSNGSSFGNLTNNRTHMGSGMSSGTRGVFQGGWAGSHGAHNGRMDYVTFASPGNATYFGTFGHENYGASAVSDGTTGVIGSGYDATSAGHHYTAKYITLETLSNASTFGTITQGYWGSAVSSGTRGVFGGYSRSGWTRSLVYITIQTPSNSTDFGNSISHYGHSNSTSDSIKGIYMGGWNGSWSGSIEYITISTPSNGTTFGNTRTNIGDGVAISDGTRAVSCGNWWNTTMDYVVVATPMNSIEFGQLSIARGSRPSGASGN